MDQNNDDRGIDLSHALDNSNSRIKFEGKDFQRPSQSFQKPTPKIVEWVIKYSGGYVKNERQANYVLIGFVAVAIIICFLLFFGDIGNSKAKTLTNNQIEQIIKNQKGVKNP